MNDRSAGRRRGLAARAGFSLIELLVVLAILATLVLLSAGAAMRVLAGRAARNTETALTKIDSAFRRAWEAVLTQARKEDMRRFGDGPYNQILAAAGNSVPRARVLYVKLRLKQEFPMTFAEVLTPSGPLPAREGYASYLQNRGVTAPANPAGDHESAVGLLLALQQGRSGAAPSGDDLGNSVKPVNGLPALVDDWGRPLAFYRWPTGNTEVDGLAPASASTARDPQDPDGLLLDPGWWRSAGRGKFEHWCHSVTRDGQPYAYYLIPVIASAGPNGRLGIRRPAALGPDPMAADGTADADDNLYNFRLQSAGARGE
jgi:prepilin-type N-terminal cleavage/methylation domain-containing protein